MVRVLIGDLFTSRTQTLVNTVNCVGVMGKGIALEFKKRFPDMYRDYVTRCERGEVRLGRPYLHKQLFPPWVLNFPTKDHWRSVARLEHIVQGLRYLQQHHAEWGIESLAVPPLGCGEGQLEWRVVGPTLYRHLSQLAVPVELYAPFGTSHAELQPEFLEAGASGSNAYIQPPQPQRVPPAWVALVEILQRIDQQPYHWPVGRTTFQKIAYVATLEGLPTELHYQPRSYGPFAPELKPLLTRLANNGLIQEERLGQMFHVRPGPTFGDARRAYASDLTRWESTIERVVDLFVRLNTHQAEVVATVMSAAQAERQSDDRMPSECDVLRAVMAWKQRRQPPLDEKEVADAIRDLAAMGWLKVHASHDLPVSEEMSYG
jgi:O-acetyl-ADP-ribose deacetylase (regulator of RNase III)/uncharacterized protein YwgA